MRNCFKKFSLGLALLVALVLGGASLTQAHGRLSTRTILPLVPRGGISLPLGHSPGYVLRPTLDCEAWDPLAPLTGSTASHRSLTTPVALPNDFMPFASPHAPKVSLYMLDSVLLI